MRGPVEQRATRVRIEDFARPLAPEAAAAVLDSLPNQLGARALREVVDRVAEAHRRGRPVVAMCGGHVVKVGVSPCLITLLERGVITHLALNGAAALHDIEIARSKSHVLKPMTPAEAVLQMEQIHHDFYVFINGETERVAVVYRRRAGGYGLIEPEAA